MQTANSYTNPCKRYKIGKQSKMKIYSIFVNGSFIQNSVGDNAMQAIQLFARNQNIRTGNSMSVGQCGKNIQYCAKQTDNIYPCGLRTKCAKKLTVESSIGNIVAVESM